MSDDVLEAIAIAEQELRSIEAAHLTAVEQELAADRAQNAAVAEELQGLTARALTLRDQIDALNNRVDAKPSVQWQSHVGAFGLAIVVAALGLLFVVIRP